MKENPSNLEKLEQFKAGMKVVKKGTKGIQTEYYTYWKVEKGMVQLKTSDGKIIELYPDYFLENFGTVDTAESKEKAEAQDNKPVYPEIIVFKNDGPDGIKCISDFTGRKADKIIFN